MLLTFRPHIEKPIIYLTLALDVLVVKLSWSRAKFQLGNVGQKVLIRTYFLGDHRSLSTSSYHYVYHIACLSIKTQFLQPFQVISKLFLPLMSFDTVVQSYFTAFTATIPWIQYKLGYLWCFRGLHFSIPNYLFDLVRERHKCEQRVNKCIKRQICRLLLYMLRNVDVNVNNFVRHASKVVYVSTTCVSQLFAGWQWQVKMVKLF